MKKTVLIVITLVLAGAGVAYYSNQKTPEVTTPATIAPTETNAVDKPAINGGAQPANSSRNEPLKARVLTAEQAEYFKQQGERASRGHKPLTPWDGK